MIETLPRQKITFGEMRAGGVRGLLIYRSDYKCSHWTAISGDRWTNDIRLSDIEPRFTCQACGRCGADVRPNFHWEAEARREESAGGSPARWVLKLPAVALDNRTSRVANQYGVTEWETPSVRSPFSRS